jgi:hypothetical protein
VVDQIGTVTTNASQQNIGAVTGITPTTANTGIIAVFAKAVEYTNSDVLTGDSLPWDRGQDISTAQGNGASLIIQTALDGGTTTVTSKTLTVSGGSAAVGLGVIFNLNPDAGTPPPVPTYSLHVNVAGTGGGTVETTANGGIVCGTGGTDCDEIYPENQVVYLKALPDSGSDFDSWGGDASGSDTQIAVTMNASKTISATFNTLPAPPDPPSEGVVAVVAGTGTTRFYDPLHRHNMEVKESSDSSYWEASKTGSWEYSTPWRCTCCNLKQYSHAVPPDDQTMPVFSNGGSPYQVVNRNKTFPYYRRSWSKVATYPDFQGDPDPFPNLNNHHEAGIYDKYRSSSKSSRVGLYKGYKYSPGEHSITYFDFRMMAGRANAHPRNMKSGGGNTFHTQLCQLKTWDQASHFIAFGQARDGIKSTLAHKALGNELMLPCPENRWLRLGIEVNWKLSSGSWPNNGANGGWLRIWADLDGSGVMKNRTVNKYGAGADGKVPYDLLSNNGNTYFCFGNYHRLVEYLHGDVWCDYANVTICNMT